MATSTVVPPSAGVTGAVTQYVWAAFLIAQINAAGGNVPYTTNNVENIVRWMTAEEPASDWWHNSNPLNINAGGSGSDTFPNLTAAAIATAKLIHGSYPGILAALTQDAPANTFSAAVVASPWAASHYGGNPSHIAQIPLAAPVSAGDATTVLPADPGAATPANPAPGPLGAIAGLATGGTSVPGSGGWTAELGALLGDLVSAEWWQRVGLFAAGAVLVIGGLVLFVSTTKTGQKVESEAAVAAVAA